MKTAAILLLAVYAAALQVGQLNFVEVSTHEDLDKALRDGPVLIFIHSPTCPSCKYMISEVFTREDVAKSLRGVNLVSIDVSKSRISSLEVEIDGQVYIYYGGLRTYRGSGRENLPILATPTVVMGYVKNGTLRLTFVAVGAVNPATFLQFVNTAYSGESSSRLPHTARPDEASGGRPAEESGTQPQYASFILQLLTSFAAGAVSVFSPCVLPVVTIAATTVFARRNLLVVLLGMVASYAALATALSGATVVAKNAVTVLYAVGGAALIAMGSMLLFERLNKSFVTWVSRFQSAAHRAARRQAGVLGDLALGASLGAIWTPCIAPIFGAVAVANVVFSSLRGDYVAVFFTTLAYALGLSAVIYLVVTIVRKKAGSLKSRGWGAIGRKIEYGVGVVSIILGVLLIGEALGLGTFSAVFAP